MVVLELRPDWCLSDEVVDAVVSFGEWVDDDGQLAFARDGDSWSPGSGLTLRRSVTLDLDVLEARRQLGISPGAVIGVAARWVCSATATAGVHVDGPKPLPLAESVTLELDVPAALGRSLEIETSLIVTWEGDRPAAACPDRAQIWSDGWSLGKGERAVLLEGSEGRIPVSTVSFRESFGEPSQAVWSIELDAGIRPEDLMSNVVTVLLNRDVLEREYKGSDGEPDASLLAPALLAGIQVDLIRCLTKALAEDLADQDEWDDMEEGSAGSVLVTALKTAFGSVDDALAALEHDEPAFSRALWHMAAPDRWRAS